MDYYKPSGQFSLISFLYFILASLVCLPILAVIYTYLTWYIPFVYINLFITIGFGFGVGFILSFFAIKLGKVRNPSIAMIFGVIGGLIALYFSWAIWVDLVINADESYGNSRIGFTTSNIKLFQVVDLALNPKLLFEIIAEVNEYGTWGFGSTTVSGVFLTIIWIIEALIVIVLAVLTPLGQSKIPFCELNNNWFKATELPAFNLITNRSEFIKAIKNVDLTHFDNLKKVINPKLENHSIFTLYNSKKGDAYLSIENCKIRTNRKGEVETVKDEFVTYIALNRELKDQLLAIT